MISYPLHIRIRLKEMFAAPIGIESDTKNAQEEKEDVRWNEACGWEPPFAPGWIGWRREKRSLPESVGSGC
jgi:hypothetical protein